MYRRFEKESKGQVSKSDFLLSKEHDLQCWFVWITICQEEIGFREKKKKTEERDGSFDGWKRQSEEGELVEGWYACSD